MLWELKLGTRQYAIPTIDRGRLYVGCNDANFERAGVEPSGGGVLACYDLETMDALWRFHTPRYVEGLIEPYHFNHWKCGFATYPVVEGDFVYVVGGRGEILCLDREGQRNGNAGPFVDELRYMEAAEGTALEPCDGDIVWRYDLIEEIDVVPHDVCGSTLLIDGEYLYACTSNGVDGKHAYMPRPQAPSLIALDKRTGELVARECEGIGERTLHGQWSSPSLGRVEGRTLIFFGGGDGVLYAFEPPVAHASEERPQALKKAWSYDCNPPEYRTIDGQPAAYSSDKKKLATGPSEIIGTPVFDHGKVYAAIGQSPLHGPGQGQLSCIDAATGQPVWTNRDVGRSLATVSIADGLLYIVELAGILRCFDAETGEAYWEHDLGGDVWRASTFVADGKVYASDENKAFWTFAAGKEKRLLAQFRLKGEAITPTAIDGMLLIPTQVDLKAYAARQASSEGLPAKQER
ncbi:MAG: outer membrane biogenesis protein BamB [candidate division BRC1 bacterium ADurb.BinA364]|nr:MAG: outer membrane biogenesis protein BamB [candidate division BRC1 bacterium ADurb.BinA364]